MINKIQKRDGKVVEFDSNRIVNAISKAGQATCEFDKTQARNLAFLAIDKAKSFFDSKIPTIEDIQDVVEETLLESSFHKSAKAYTIYRDQHNKIREIIDNDKVDMIDQYLQQLDWQVNENSNMTYSLQGLNNYMSSEMSKVYWLNKIYPNEVKDAHLSGDLHIHDMNVISVYCVGWDLHDLLLEGFKGAPGKIESAPPKHFRTALGQMVNFLFTLQGEAAGAQAFSSVDTLLAPFIRHDNLGFEEVKQALQEFVFNLNVPTRIGFQTPFTNITLDLEVPSTWADNAVIIGGEPQETCYSDYQAEMNMFNKAFFEVMMEGDARGRVFTFPIPTYNITKEFNWDNPDLEGLWEMTAKYGVPYFSNFINSDMSPEDARSMCCRLRIDNRELESRGGGLFGSNPLTGSIGVVTMNLARIGAVAVNEQNFLSRLGRLMDIAKNSLEIKRKILERFTGKDLYPYSKFYLKGIKQRHDQYWKNHFSTIGINGMNEACLNLFGEDISTDKSREFTLRVLDFMRDKLSEFQQETGNNYNLEATPAEGTSYRFAKLDKEKHPTCKAANESEYQDGAEPFYSNSTQLPIMHSEDIFEVLDHQDDIQAKYTGGTVIHMFAGERLSSTQAVKNLVRKVCENYKLPYFTFSPTFSICPSHGYIGGEQPTCPTCKAQTEVYSRIVGYIRPVNQWNKGKKSEFKLRKTFNLEEGSLTSI